ESTDDQIGRLEVFERLFAAGTHRAATHVAHVDIEAAKTVGERQLNQFTLSSGDAERGGGEILVHAKATLSAPGAAGGSARWLGSCQKGRMRHCHLGRPAEESIADPAAIGQGEKAAGKTGKTVPLAPPAQLPRAARAWRSACR